MQLSRVTKSMLAVATAVMVGACGGVASNTGNSNATPPPDVGSGNLTGAGATFPEPFYTKAFYQYNQLHSNVQINYQAVGSGAGIQQYTKGTVDFGASDVPMTQAEVTAAGGADSLVEIPTTLGVVAIAYNVPAVNNLQLDGTTLAGIFLGTIKNWDDPAIKALNSGASLPSKPITVVHRSDGSGTTYAFTDYLGKVSPDWKSKVGVAKSVSWPVGIGGQGNAGVGQSVKQTDNSIGYVELAYVVQTGMQAATLKNADGKFVKPSLDGATAAAAANTSPSPDNFSITNNPGATTYPIASFSWVILKKSQADATKGRALVYLFDWLTKDGQSFGKDLQYAPLPKPAQTYAATQLKSITANGAPILK
ncbi:MAG TPA: phosphate ABC transporter substrate-binding protein PstS [Candidatus Dormibacteraeota bacterium]